MNFGNEKIIETKNCKKCSCDFSITDKDLEFYKKISPKFSGEIFAVGSSEFCPECRNIQRELFVNERNLYKGICDSCNLNIISRFHDESGINVYCNECWSSDLHKLLKNGLDISFDESIFQQINTLIHTTNFQNLIGSFSNIKSNSTYTNHTADINNSYMIFESDDVSDCLYSRGLRKSEKIVNSLNCSDSQEIYECVDCNNMYKSYFAQNSSNCNNCYYILNCNNCSDCIGCTNLDSKQYYILNKKVTRDYFEEYKENNFLKDIGKCREILTQGIRKQNFIIGSEDCNGDYIVNSKNTQYSFDILGCEDIKYCTDVNNSQDLMDVSSYGSKSYLMYNSVSVGRYSKNILFSSIVGRGENLLYCIEVKKSKDCFACVNLKDKQYCILNKQYTKEEYNKLVPQIIKKMEQNGEWGEFFPSSLSPFGYNETVASEYCPLIKSEALKQGFNWSDYEAPIPKVEKIIPANKLPEKIEDIPDDILNWAIECEITQKPFKIIQQELEFYRKNNLPIPRRHPDQRHLDRMRLRNPRKLFMRNCDKCNNEIQTPYSIDRPEIVYCEECYNKEIY